ncbi:uncharacterized protein LOC123258151 [Drosophila ananassae]|uniref:uncharacterized protein LOC123258151 n=1 Tax=Drosophila ananassae TaxID=7217 RepID=UPI001CFFB8EF|nr:uncharacterized protein LOC123258151 [Drosophila ananassae]
MANNDTSQDDSDVFTRGSDVVINRVAVKIPPFWTEHPELWLSQIEAQFVLAGITTDDTIFNTILASIEAPVLARIADAIVNQPGTGKYENLKSCILERFCESEQKKIQKLISETDLGDKRPTQLLNELNALAANKVDETFLKALWLQRLPTQVQAILQASDACLADLDKLADKVMEVGDIHHIRTVDAKSAPHSSTVFDERLDRIEQQINALFKNRYRKNSSSTLTDRNSVPTSGLCWYHSKFGNAAKKCRQPCSYHNTIARLAINDNYSKTQFLIDTGADISVKQPCRIAKTMLTPKLLFAANVTKIQTYGEKHITVSLGLRRNFVWTFVLADVNCAIIGADFLQPFDLLVDVKRRKLIDRATLYESTYLAPQRKINAILSYDTSNARLLHEYRDLATINSNRLPEESDVTHPPSHARARRLAPDKLKEHRALSNVTVPDRYTIPYILDVTSIVHGKKIFSKIDLQKAYHQNPVEPQDIPKTAIITPFGLFEFLFMTFGLRNAVQTFRRHINNVIQDLDFVFAYIDDVLIASESEEQHETHLRTTLDRLTAAHLTVNFEKTQFAKSQLTFLGHDISQLGLKPSEAIVEAIRL